ncbi:MAG: AsmA-like C-terminal domain-containing protein [Nitrospirota bacterium]
MKRPLRWLLVFLIVIPLLFVGLTILAQRLINHEAIKNRIETAVSRDLGGRLAYERVGLAILPRPQVVITNPSLTVPGSVNAKSNSLKVGFEFLPLLVGKARLADVRLERPDVTLILDHQPSEKRAADPAASRRSLSSVLGWLAATMPNLTIRIDQGQVVVLRGQEPVFTLQDAAIRLAFAPIETTSQGSAPTTPAPFRIAGTARGVLTDNPAFPGPVAIRIGAFEAGPRTFTLSNGEARVLDADGTVSGRIDDYLTARPSADFTIAGTIDSKTMQWLHTKAALPEELLLRAPVSVKSAHAVWTSGRGARVTGSASVQQDVAITFNVQRDPEHFSVDELSVRDKDSQAAFAMDLRNRVLTLSFAGHLAHSTLARVFQQQRVQFGSLKGAFKSRIILDRPRDSTAEGHVEGDRLVLPVQTRVPVFIDRVAARAEKQSVSVDPLVLTVGEVQHTIRGQIAASAEQWLLDLTIDRLHLATITSLVGSGTANAETPAAEPSRDAEPRQPIRATIRVAADSFTAGEWTAAPARADIVIGPEPPHITVHEAVVCGITVAGSATIAGDATRIAITPSAKGQNLGPTLECLVGKPMRVTGTFDLSGKLDSTGTGKALLDNLNGPFAVSIKGGRFYADSTVVRILSYLNLTEMLRGAFPDPGSDGLPYKSVVVRSTTKQGHLVINEAVLTSSTAHMAAKGSLDLRAQVLDITVLVAPLTTVDAVVKRIPLLRDILAGSLVTIPVRVTGPFDDPKVDAVPPGAVAKELGGIMERTLKLPFKILEPVIPGKKTRTETDGG